MKARHLAAAILYISIQGVVLAPATPSTAADGPPDRAPRDASPETTSKADVSRGYENSINRLSERRMEVKDDLGRPAVRSVKFQPVGDVDLKIVWTIATDFGWNYTLPEFPGGKNAFESAYPSAEHFLQKTAGAKTILSLAVPDTPYSFYIIDGRPSAYFVDSEKMVLWQLDNKTLGKVLRQTGSISVASKSIQFLVAGGDWAAYLVIDFSDRQSSPRIKYYERNDGL